MLIAYPQVLWGVIYVKNSYRRGKQKLSEI